MGFACTRPYQAFCSSIESDIWSTNGEDSGHLEIEGIGAGDETKSEYPSQQHTLAMDRFEDEQTIKHFD